MLASSFDTLCLWGFCLPKFSQDHSACPSGRGRVSGTGIRPRREGWPLQLLDHDAVSSKEAMSAESVRELWPVRDQLCFSAICLVLCHLCAGVNDNELAMISTSCRHRWPVLSQSVQAVLRSLQFSLLAAIRSRHS